jgi:hypothetical protein
VIAAGVALLAAPPCARALADPARPSRWRSPPASSPPAGIELDGGLGDKTYRPGTAPRCARATSSAPASWIVDLRGTTCRRATAACAWRSAWGVATLLVDEDVCVATDARVGMGAVEFFDRDSAGVDIDVAEGSSAPKDTTRLLLDADVGLGLVEVRHTEPWADRWDRDWDEDGPPPPPNPPFDRDMGFDPRFDEGNEACTGATN